MVNRRVFAALCAALLLCGANLARAEEKKGHGHDHGHGPNGGALQELGDKEDHHAELKHDDKTGTLTLWILGADAKTPVAIKDAPKLNLKSKDGNKQLEMTAVGAKDGAAAQWTATDEKLKADPIDGRIQVKLNDGKKYNVKLEEHSH